MNFGLEIYSAQGEKRVSLTSRLGRIIDFIPVGAGESGSKQFNLEAIGAPNGIFVVSIAQAVGLNALVSISHFAQVSTTSSVATVSWVPPAPGGGFSSASYILVLPK